MNMNTILANEIYSWFIELYNVGAACTLIRARARNSSEIVQVASDDVALQGQVSPPADARLLAEKIGHMALFGKGTQRYCGV
jgi:hypothetical protein